MEPQPDRSLDDIQRRIASHSRSQREAGFNALAAVIIEADAEAVKEFAADALRVGLADNWSQVRFAAAVAARNLVLKLQRVEGEDKVRTDQVVMQKLVPPMCANRYYAAEGLRNYSLETWKILVGNQGASVVGDCIPQIVQHYEAEARSENYTVRESVCYCMAELARKIEAKKVRSYAVRMLNILRERLGDLKWQVRAASARAIGDVVAAFHTECRPFMPELSLELVRHLFENVGVVRDDCAVALGTLDEVYPEIFNDLLCDTIREKLPMAKQQTQNLESPADRILNSGDSVDEEKGFPGFLQPTQPWELSDGAMFLLREMSARHADACEQFLLSVLEILNLSHFFHHVYLKETIWRQLPVIARNLGPAKFKPHMDPFLSPLFYSLKSKNRLLEQSAADCVANFFIMYDSQDLLARLDEEWMRDEFHKNSLVQESIGTLRQIYMSTTNIQ